MLENYPELLKSKEVCEILQIKKITLIRWGKKGKLVPAIRINNRGDKRYTKKQLLSFLGQDTDNTMQPFSAYPEILTIKNVMDMLRVSRISLTRWAKQGILIPEIILNDRGDKRYTKKQILQLLGYY